MDEEDVKVIIGYLAKGVYPPGMTPNGKRCLRQKTRAFKYYEDGSLYHCGKSNRHHQLVVVNPDERMRLILEAHTEPNLKQGGDSVIHRGVNATIKKIGAKFWWKRLVEDVRVYCKNCAVCKEAAVAALSADDLGGFDIDRAGSLLQEESRQYNDNSTDVLDDFAEADNVVCETTDDVTLPVTQPQELLEYTSSVYPSHMMSSMRELYEARAYCDVLLSCEGYQTQAHKIILMASSSHFKSLLLDPDLPIHDSISFPGMTGWCLDALVTYLYSGKLLLNRDNVELLKSSAASLGITTAVSLCDTFLQDLENQLIKQDVNNEAEPVKDEALIDTCQEDMGGANVDDDDADTVVDDEINDVKAVIKPTTSQRGRPAKRKHLVDSETSAVNSKSLRSSGRPLTRFSLRSRTKSKTVESSVNRHELVTRSKSACRKSERLKKRTDYTMKQEKDCVTDKNHKRSELNSRISKILSSMRRAYCCAVCNKRFSTLTLRSIHQYLAHNVYFTPFSLSYLSSRMICNFYTRQMRLVKVSVDAGRGRTLRGTKQKSRTYSNRKSLCSTDKASQIMCQYCDFTCNLKSKLKAHLISLHKLRYPRCRISLIRSRQIKSLTKIRNRVCKTAQLKVSTNIKQEANRSRTLKSKFKPGRRHGRLSNQLTDQSDPVFIRCGWCGTMFHSRAELLAHRLSMHRGKPKPSESEVNKAAVQRSWGCVEKGCGGVFKTKDQIRDHMNKTHPEISYTCPNCPFRTLIDQVLRRHLIRRHKERHICQECGKAYHKPFLLRIHLFNKHRRSDPLLKLHRCKYEGCTYVCPSKNGMSMHLLKHGQSGRYPCSSCGKAFKRVIGLEKHCNKVHLGLKPFVCDKCGDAFVDEPELKNHMNRHAESKPFSCKLCNFSTFQSGSLKSHMFTRHQVLVDRKMSVMRCDQCTFTTDKKCRYNDHMKMHLNIRDIPCPECNKMFITKKTLRQHIVKVHMRSNKAAILASSSAATAATTSSVQQNQQLIEYKPDNELHIMKSDDTAAMIQAEHLLSPTAILVRPQQLHDHQIALLEHQTASLDPAAHRQIFVHPVQHQQLLEMQKLIQPGSQLRFDLHPQHLMLMHHSQQQLELEKQQLLKLESRESQQQQQHAMHVEKSSSQQLLELSEHQLMHVKPEDHRLLDVVVSLKQDNLSQLTILAPSTYQQ